MAVCARCSAPLVATARFCAACGNPVALATTPRPESRAVESRPDSRGPTAQVPIAPDPFASTVMGDPNAVAAAAAALAAARPEVRTNPPRQPTAPMAQSPAIAPARPNPVSPMASSVMHSPGDPQRPSGAPTPWNATPNPAAPPPAQARPWNATPNPIGAPPQQPPWNATPNPIVPQANLHPGTMVLVYWANGQRYHGTVLQASGTQVLVAFPNGQQHWVDMRYVSTGG